MQEGLGKAFCSICLVVFYMFCTLVVGASSGFYMLLGHWFGFLTTVFSMNSIVLVLVSLCVTYTCLLGL